MCTVHRHVLTLPWALPQLTDLGRYEGTYVDGLRAGRGMMMYANGEKYSGDIGHGAVTTVSSLFDGDEYKQVRHTLFMVVSCSAVPPLTSLAALLAQGTAHNVGVYEFVDGSMYEGQWVRGRPNGRGTFTAPNGDITTGMWKNGILHGVRVCAECTL